MRPPSEAGFQRTVIELARLRGWLVHHSRAAVNRRGRWSTPLIGHPGLPDLILVRERVIWAELKTKTKKTTADQLLWLDTLIRAGCEVYVWRPSMWDIVRRVLE